MLNKVYVVQRRGVYDRGICGIAYTLNRAKKIRENAVNAEPDDYHTFHILRVPMDTFNQFEIVSDYMFGNNIEYSWSESTEPINGTYKKR